MELIDDEPFLGCGRGGRAALLAAALQKQNMRLGKPYSEDSSGQTSPSASGETFGSSSPLSQSASSGGSAVSTPRTLGGHGFPAMQSFRAGGAPPPGSRGPLTVLERSLLHTPVGRSAASALSQMQQSGEPAQKLPQPAQYGEPQRRPPTPPPGHSSGPPQDAMARPSGPPQDAMAHPESGLQMPAARMADQSMNQYNRGKPIKQALPEVSYVRLGTGKQYVGVFEHQVNFVPKVDSKRCRFDLLGNEAVLTVIGRTHVFDGHKLLLPRQLREESFRVPAGRAAANGRAVVVHITFVRKVPPAECVNLYIALFKKVMQSLQLAQLGRNYFDRKGAILVPKHKLEVWPGLVQSVAECEGGLLLNCDSSFQVLRTITAREVLSDVFNAYPCEYKARAAHALKGTIVMTRYNYRTYRVDDIAWHLRPTSTFTFHSGELISYKDYYKRIYNLEIEDWDQPLLLHRDKPRRGALETEEARLVCLVPELCTLTGLTDTMRSDFRVMKDIAAHTRVNARQRQHALMQFMRNVHECEPARKVLDEWGLTLDDASIHVRGGRRGSRRSFR